MLAGESCNVHARVVQWGEGVASVPDEGRSEVAEERACRQALVRDAAAWGSIVQAPGAICTNRHSEPGKPSRLVERALGMHWSAYYQVSGRSSTQELVSLVSISSR